MAFDPDAYVAQKSAPLEQPGPNVTVSGFNPDEYVAQKAKTAPVEESSGFKLGNLSDAGVSAERMLNAIAKPPAALAEYAGWGAPAKALMARDEYLKQHSGLGASLSSLGGDVAGLMIPGGAAGKVAEATSMLPKATELMERIPGAAKLLETGPAWLEKTLGSKYAQAAGLGGTSSFLAPTGKDITEPGFAEQHTAEAGTGAALGPVFTKGASMVGTALDPAMKRFKDLLAQGFTKEQIMKGSFGQVVGGLAQKAEDIGAYIPFGGISSLVSKGQKSFTDAAKNIEGSITKTAKEKAAQLDTQLANANVGLTNTQKGVVVPAAKAKLDSDKLDLQNRYDDFVKTTTDNMNERHANEFSRPIIQKALDPVGVTLPDEHQGTEAIKFAQGVEKQLYDSGIEKVGDIRIGDNELNSLKSVLDASKHRLGGEGSDLYNKLASRVDEIKDTAGDSKLISAGQWHNIFKDLGAEAQNYKGPLSSGTDREYGSAVTNLKNKWMDIIEGTEGSDIIKKANAVHSALQVPQTAAGYLNTYMEKGGKFDPKDFLRALKSESSNKRFAAGDSRLQEEALAAYQKMADEKLALKASHDTFKTQLTAKKKEKAAEMGANLTLQNKNIANQKAYLKTQKEAEKEVLKTQVDTKKEALDKTLEDVSNTANDAYAKHRIMYGMLGLGGTGAIGQALPLDATTKLGIAGAALTGSHIYAAPPVQAALKAAALSRPDIARVAGQKLKEKAPLIGGLAAYSANQSNTPPK